MPCLCWPGPVRAAPAEPARSEPAAEPPEPTGSQPIAKQAWIPELELHGGVSVYLYQPTNGWDPLFFVYSNVKLKATWDYFGIYVEPRFSSEKMRVYYDSLAWIQQAYLFAEFDPFVLKVGKIYKQSGLFWDNTFYGNIQVYEGLKFDPNVGLSLEATFGKQAGVVLVAQYFLLDGHLNASLLGRDTVSIPGARRRNILSGRVQPFFQLTKAARLEFGLSAEEFTADLPQEDNAVGRIAGDVKLTWKGLGLWGEVLHQFGRSVTAFPYPEDPSTVPPTSGRSSGDNTYLLAGAEFKIGPVVPRYNLSIASYGELAVREVLHLPGVSVQFHEHASIYVEYAFWDRTAPEQESVVDRSLNLTVMGYF
jgi:hypothetical protein